MVVILSCYLTKDTGENWENSVDLERQRYISGGIKLGSKR